MLLIMGCTTVCDPTAMLGLQQTGSTGIALAHGRIRTDKYTRCHKAPPTSNVLSSDVYCVSTWRVKFVLGKSQLRDIMNVQRVRVL